MTAKMLQTTSKKKKKKKKKKGQGHHTTPEEVVTNAKAIPIALPPFDVDITFTSSATSKAKPVRSWTRRSILGLLEFTEDHGMWKHGYGAQKEILKKMALDLEQCHGVICLLPTIRRVYEDLLKQAQKEACEDAKKMGEVVPADVIMMQVMKLVEMAADNKHLDKVSFLFYLFYNRLEGGEPLLDLESLNTMSRSIACITICESRSDTKNFSRMPTSPIFLASSHAYFCACLRRSSYTRLIVGSKHMTP